MPRKMRFAKQRSEISQNQIEQMITGHDYFGGGFIDEKEMEQAWIDNRERVTQKAAEDTIRPWPVYAELRFDQGMNRQEALAARNAVVERLHRERQQKDKAHAT
jgi:hypothetical protein